MGFVQVIEYETTRKDELDNIFDEWVRASEGKRTAFHELHTQDRDRPGHFVDIVEFPSYEQAMRNSDLPETRTIAEKMRELCSGEPRFMNLEVLRDEKI
ncbi:hypothetical protein LO771_29295 [Streptacidiphilus sp. ASG 303]|uniref:hypothetical protein n=1 Tax=Streptacidiphilus sp. ASG 303 TaxID=2896847 RepID=UPI001E3F7C9D|nr:hypothetical protein [Streptacidiphilus sp. ASG 303]MCD0486366.1 hypothetical protein [Streptacidiphilus sp. ASG 303]